MDIHWDILDKNRKDILSILKEFKIDGFYLAGGTGLALLLGHRDSIDFDFFKEGDFDTSILIQKLEDLLKNYTLIITQNEKNTVSCIVNNQIKLSFFGYKYKLVQPPVETEYFPIASVVDIACMKLSVITSRSLEKDYIDLYFILQNFKLNDLLTQMNIKIPILDTSLVLKSLVYFDDVLNEPILFKENNEVSFIEVKEFLRNLVKGYFLINK